MEITYVDLSGRIDEVKDIVALVLFSDRGHPMMAIKMNGKDIYQVSKVGDEEFDSLLEQLGAPLSPRVHRITE